MKPSFDLVIRPEGTDRGYWHELWAARGLFVHLARRDLRVRYKQTALGILWGLIRPFLSMGAFTIVFGLVAQLPTHGTTAYPLMVLAGILPWQLFATGILHASNALTNGSAIISRVYFPRLVLPAAALVNGLVDFIVGLVVLVVILCVMGDPPSWRVVFLPAFAALALLAAAGIGAMLSALNVRYRDFGYLTPFLLQLGLFLSPVGFASASLPEAFRLLYALNPMVAVIDGFRWALLEPANLHLDTVLLSIGVSLVLLASGVFVFRRLETSFVDDV